METIRELAERIKVIERDGSWYSDWGLVRKAAEDIIQQLDEAPTNIEEDIKIMSGPYKVIYDGS